jgi:hypothetical protein
MTEVVGAVTSGSALVIGTIPGAAMAMTYMAMADSLSLAMGNAVANQQRGQVIGNAVLVEVLALIITKGAAGK